MMRAGHFFAGILLVAGCLPAMAAPWVLRPGLWEFTQTVDDSPFQVPPNASPQQRAMIESLNAQRAQRTPSPPSRQCLAEPFSTQSMFDPQSQPPGVCTAKTTAQDAVSREEDIDCTVNRIPIHVHRRLLLTGSQAGMLDVMEITGGRPGDSMTQKFRWVGAECGDVKPEKPLSPHS